MSVGYADSPTHGETEQEDIVEPDRGFAHAHVLHALDGYVQDGQHGIHAQILADSCV